MQSNRVLPASRASRCRPLHIDKSNIPQLPQITIRGHNNLINVGSSGVVKVGAREAGATHSRPLRNRQWPRQILDAIRLKAAKNRCSNDELCELAGRVLGRAVLTLERLSARELARVYEAVCAGGREPD